MSSISVENFALFASALQLGKLAVIFLTEASVYSGTKDKESFGKSFLRPRALGGC